MIAAPLSESRYTAFNLSLLRLVLQNFCPPHLLLVFIFNKIVGWSAEKIAAQTDNLTLRQTTGLLERTLVENGFPESEVRRLFAKFRQNLVLKLIEMATKEVKQKKKGKMAGFVMQEAKRISKKEGKETEKKAADTKKKVANWVKDLPFKDEFAGRIPLKAFFVKRSEQVFTEKLQTQVDRWNSDEELTLICVAQDWDKDPEKRNKKAFYEIYGIYYQDVLTKIEKHPGVRGEGQAADIASDLAEKVFRSIKKYNPAFSNFKTFITLRLNYVVLDHLGNPGIEQPLDDHIAKGGPLTPPHDDEHEARKHEKQCEKLKEFLFESIFSTNSDPHELIAFGYNHIRDIPPREIVKKHSKTKLRFMANHLQKDCLATSGISKEKMQKYFAPLRQKLEKKVRELKFYQKLVKNCKDWQKPEMLAKLYKGVLEKCKNLRDFGNSDVKDTTLQDYFINADLENNITRWCENVRRRVFSRLTRTGKLEDFSECFGVRPAVLR